MIAAIKKILGIGPSVNFAELVQNGAQIIDVRTPGEYAGGNIKGSKNYPLQQLSNNYKKLDKNKPVITCCASGMRSASAKAFLAQKGFEQVYNGGGWASLQAKLRK